MDLVKDNILQIPLYHGTSTIFEDSIRQYGLGGLRSERLYSLDSFKFLKDFFEGSNNEWWIDKDYRSTVDFILEDRVLRTASYRYGGVYLSPSIISATKYAQNRYGSEYLSILLEGVIEIEKIAPQIAKAFLADNAELEQLLTQTGKPLVVKANNLQINQLRAENGDDANKTLSKMINIAEAVPSAPVEVLWQQSNFECVEVIPANNLEFLTPNPDHII